LRRHIIQSLNTTSQLPAREFVGNKDSLRNRARRQLKKYEALYTGEVPKTWEKLEELGIPDKLKTRDDGSPFLRYFGPVSEGSLEKMAVFASDTGMIDGFFE
jgi:hypothetical protein